MSQNIGHIGEKSVEVAMAAQEDNTVTEHVEMLPTTLDSPVEILNLHCVMNKWKHLMLLWQHQTPQKVGIKRMLLIVTRQIHKKLVIMWIVYVNQIWQIQK